MRPGSIALARIQQADGRLKLRPVVVLTTIPPFSDYLVCALSSKLHQESAGFDEVIAVGDNDFEASGLKVASLIRLGMVATIPQSEVLGELGWISAAATALSVGTKDRGRTKRCTEWQPRNAV